MNDPQSEEVLSGPGAPAAQSGEGWELFMHDADMGVRGHGATLAEAFEKAAFAMTATITDPAGVAPRECVDVACAAGSDEMLFYDWLNAIVFEMATRAMLFSRFEVSIEDGRLSGRLWGEDVDVARHQPAVEVKGATLTELRVERGGDGAWRAQCVVDV